MLRRVRSRLRNPTRKNSVDVVNAIEFAHATGKCSYGIRNGLHDLIFLDKCELPDAALDKSLEIIFRVACFDQQIDFKRFATTARKHVETSDLSLKTRTACLGYLNSSKKRINAHQSSLIRNHLFDNHTGIKTCSKMLEILVADLLKDNAAQNANLVDKLLQKLYSERGPEAIRRSLARLLIFQNTNPQFSHLFEFANSKSSEIIESDIPWVPLINTQPEDIRKLFVHKAGGNVAAFYEPMKTILGSDFDNEKQHNLAKALIDVIVDKTLYCYNQKAYELNKFHTDRVLGTFRHQIKRIYEDPQFLHLMIPYLSKVNIHWIKVNACLLRNMERKNGYDELERFILEQQKEVKFGRIPSWELDMAMKGIRTYDLNFVKPKELESWLDELLEIEGANKQVANHLLNDIMHAPLSSNITELKVLEKLYFFGKKKPMNKKFLERVTNSIGTRANHAVPLCLLASGMSGKLAKSGIDFPSTSKREFGPDFKNKLKQISHPVRIRDFTLNFVHYSEVLAHSELEELIATLPDILAESVRREMSAADSSSLLFDVGGFREFEEVMNAILARSARTRDSDIRIVMEHLIKTSNHKVGVRFLEALQTDARLLAQFDFFDHVHLQFAHFLYISDSYLDIVGKQWEKTLFSEAKKYDIRFMMISPILLEKRFDSWGNFFYKSVGRSFSIFSWNIKNNPDDDFFILRSMCDYQSLYKLCEKRNDWKSFLDKAANHHCDYEYFVRSFIEFDNLEGLKRVLYYFNWTDFSLHPRLEYRMIHVVREIVNSKRVDFIEMLVEYFDEVVPKYGCKELQSLHPVLIELDLVHLYDKIEPHLLAHWEYKRKSLEGIRKIEENKNWL